VATLVVEDHPDLRTPLLRQPDALKVEGAHAKTEAMGEDDGQRRVGGPDLADREVDTVGGGHQIAAVAVERLEIFVRERVVDDSAPVEHRAGHGRPGDGAYRTDSGGTGQPASAPPPAEMEDVKMVVAQCFSASR
jgi:hypothetical protein